MKRILVVFAVVLLAQYLGFGQHNIITYNIRLDTPSDGEHAWPHRKDNVISLLKFHKADIFCLQEALPQQVKQVDEAFPDFSYVGVGRDDGKEEGEFSPVFFNTSRYTKISDGQFWLSETPEKVSFGWDAACRRICTWIKLEEINTGERFYVYNTHFDHKGDQARKESASLILKRIKKESGNSPVILCGDFNLQPDAEPIKRISAALNDSFTNSESRPYGAAGTWAGFVYDQEPHERIDYIFVSKGVKVKRYANLMDSHKLSFFSDHLPVFVEVVF